MKDVDLIDMLARRLEEGLALYGKEGVYVSQKTQPTQQGVTLGDSVYLEKLFDQVYGWAMPSTKYIPDDDQFQEKEDQLYITKFQISGLFPQIPGNTDIPTASDVLNHLKRFMTCRRTIQLFNKVQVQIFRVTNVTNPKIFDEQSQFEMIPSFDLDIVHRNALLLSVPAVHRVEGTIYRV